MSTSWDGDREEFDTVPLYILWNAPGQRSRGVTLFKTLSPNSDPSQTSHRSFKDLSVGGFMRIANMITKVKFSEHFNSFSLLAQ